MAKAGSHTLVSPMNTQSAPVLYRCCTICAFAGMLAATATTAQTLPPVNPPAPSSATAPTAPEKVTLSEFVVSENKVGAFVTSPNLDLLRTVNDVQPYYVWTGADIDNSGSADINDFFSRMVPMNASNMSNSAVSDQVLGNVSNINLGGLNSTVSGFGYNNGTQNTLILLNSHRLPSMAYETQNLQPDISGIPLSAIDHIEVLQGSAAAIYGNSAAGGVVNIILKQNYSGAEFQTTYDNAFNTDAPTKKGSLNAGFSLNGGKTQVLLGLSYSTQKPLEVQDRLGLINAYDARFFAAYPGGELAYLGLPTAATAVFSQPLIVSSTAGKPVIAGTTATVLQVPAGYQSFQANGLGPLQANVGLFNLSRPDDRTYRNLTGLRYYITQAPEAKSLYFDVRQKLTSWLQAYASLMTNSSFVEQPRESFYVNAVTVPATSPFNPFGQAVKVTGVQNSNQAQESTNRVQQIANAGLIATLPHAWSAVVDFTWSSSKLNLYNPGSDATAFAAAVTAGTVNVITDLGLHPVPTSSFSPEWATAAHGSTQTDISLRAVGPLMKFWNRVPQLSVSLEHYRVGSITGLNITDTPLTPQNETFAYYTGQSSKDSAVAAELSIPVVTRSNQIAAVKQLDLQAALRVDQYSNTVNSPASETETIRGTTITYSPAPTTGNSTPPVPLTADATYNSVNKIAGFKWTTIGDVTFRASYATGFAPPTYSQLIPADENGDTYNVTGTPYPGVPTSGPWPYTQIVDPRLGNATYSVPVATGGNPNLKPETSKNFSWGVILTPSFTPGLRLSVDYARIVKHDNIITPNAALLVANESSFPGLVERAAPATGSPYAVGPIVQINATSLNAAESISSLYNVQGDYTFKLGTSAITLRAVGTFYQHYEVQTTIGSPLVEYLGNPNYLSPGYGYRQSKFKGNIGLNWNKGPWNAGWMVRYTGPYTVGTYYGTGGPQPVQGTLNGWVSGQIYHDVNAGFRVMKAGQHDAWWRRALQGSSLQVGVKNVFNHAPPYDSTSPTGAFAYWYSPYGSLMLAEYYLSFKKSF